MPQAGLKSRRRKDRSKQTASEWVDVLYAEKAQGGGAAEGGFSLSRLRKESREAQDAPTVPADEPLPASEPAERLPPLSAERAEPVRTEDGLLLREDHLDRERKLRLESQYLARGSSEAYERSWVRTRRDTIDEIRGYIDNVLAHGKPPEVATRTRWRGGSGGPPPGKPVTGEPAEALIANGDVVDKRIVYETKGGYVVAVTRETPQGRRTDYFTISKMGDVGHALDSLRDLRAVSDRVDTLPPPRSRKGAAAAPGAGALDRTEVASSPSVGAATSSKPAAPRDAATSSAAGAAPPSARAASPAPMPGSGAQREMPTLTDTPARPEEAAAATPDQSGAPERKSLASRLSFGKKPAEAPAEDAASASASDSAAQQAASRDEKRGLGGLKEKLPFGRHKETDGEASDAPADEPATAEESGEKKGLRGKLSFRRKRDQEPAE